MGGNRSGIAGASPEAVQAHYDVGDAFYSLWLDESMTYSSALWEEGDSLATAQARKLDFHAQNSRAQDAGAVLDVGAGWGSLLRHLVENYAVKRAVGLTLSESQRAYVEEFNDKRIEMRLESWREHEPAILYDAITCVGALEHFVKPDTQTTERIRAYREFFGACKKWLKPGGTLSLQTISYGLGRFQGGAIASIFPESDLPRLAELTEAMEQSFEPEIIRNDRLDYMKTCQAWLDGLRKRRAEAEREVGAATATHYENFLAASVRGFEAGIFHLLRMRLRRTNV